MKNNLCSNQYYLMYLFIVSLGDMTVYERGKIRSVLDLIFGTIILQLYPIPEIE